MGKALPSADILTTYNADVSVVDLFLLMCVGVYLCVSMCISVCVCTRIRENHPLSVFGCLYPDSRGMLGHSGDAPGPDGT